MAQQEKPEIESYRASFEEFEARLNGASQSRLHQLRRSAIDKFAQSGFPTGRDEDWRHTNLSPVTRVQFKPLFDSQPGAVTTADLDRLSPKFDRSAAGPRLVFVNGFFDSALSSAGKLPFGSLFLPLGEAFELRPDLINDHIGRNADPEQDGFSALNTAFLRDGAFLFIPKGVREETPIEITHLSVASGEPTVSFPRTLIILAEGAQATVVETYTGADGQVYLTDAETELFVGEGAQLEHCRIQLEGDHAFHIAGSRYREGRDARLLSHNLSLGAQLCRNDLSTRLDGEGIDSTLNGLYLTGGKQHIDNHTIIEHAAPNCSSHELFKGIMTQNSTGVFRGKIHVHRIAQKTDAYQSNQNLLLSDAASITSKPQLEIYADDVKCSHGSTTGQLDQDAIFYLRSRGVGEEAAINVLTRAFAGDILDRIPIETLRADLERRVSAKLQTSDYETLA